MPSTTSTPVSLSTTNKRICTFYQTYPSIQFEAVNLIMIDLLEKLIVDSNQEMGKSMQTQLLSIVNENANNIQELKSSIDALKGAMNGDLTTSIQSKFAELKQEYIEDIRTIIQANTYEKIGPLLEKNNAIIMDKTAIIINDIIPKNQNQYYTQINETLTAFHKSITEDTQSLVRSVDTQSLKDFISNFEMKSALLLQNVQQPIYSFISASEDRITSNINTIKDTKEDKVLNDLSDFLHRFRPIETIQQVQNKQLISVLTKMYNSAEIIPQPTTSTLLMKRIRKPSILIESRDTENNVSMDDIQSFIQMVDEQHCNGIFISQQSGISTKKNYQIEQHNNNIIMFIHNAEYNPAKIEVAVDIIDNLFMKLRQFKGHGENECAIPKELLDTINNEYQMFLSQKLAVIEVFKESQKKVLSQIDEIRFPTLDKYLSTKYSAPIQKPGLKCDMCKSFSANNLKALAAHKRGCARKNTNSISISPITVTAST